MQPIDDVKGCPSRLVTLASMAIFAMAMTIDIAALADENCVARSIDQVGKCHSRSFAKKVADRELRGLTPPPAEPPPGLDPDMLASQLLGELAQGQLSPVMGGTGDWVLVANAAQATDFAYRRVPQLMEAQHARATLFLLRWETSATAKTLKTATVDLVAAPEMPTVRVEASHSLAVEKWPENKASDAAGGLKGVPACVDPEATAGAAGIAKTGKSGLVTATSSLNADSSLSGETYPVLSTAFRWVQLSAERKLLAAGVSRSEGYAGGGGTFEAEILLSVEGSQLRPVACYATHRYQMFGGKWNPDGTREHPESQAGWTLQPGRKGEWPDLRLRPSTTQTPGAVLVWDAAARAYRMR